MPNRILREGILTSERVVQLTWPAEVFYRRLMSVVDDFGRFYAKPELIRSAAYPLQFDRVGNQDIAKWLAECVRAGLVRAYAFEGKEYLELLDFRQQVRAKVSKFPQMLGVCVATAEHMPAPAKHLQASAHLVGDVVEEQNKAIPPPDGGPVWTEALTILTEQGQSEKTARAFLGMLCRDYEETEVAEAVKASVGKANATAYVRGVLKNRPKKGEQEHQRIAI